MERLSVPVCALSTWIALLVVFSNVQCGLATCVITNNVNATSADVIEGNATGTYIIDCTSVMGTGDSNSWSFDGVNISTEDINQAECLDNSSVRLIPQAGRLHICKASLDSAGRYSFFGNRVQEVFLYIAPQTATYGNPNNTETDKGGTATLSCVMTGYPLPEVYWLQNGSRVSTNDSRREVNNVMSTMFRNVTSTLTITDAEYSDRSQGKFACFADNFRLTGNHSAIGTNTSAGALVRVRDPLGPLWPFLGLLAQAGILVLVLYVDGVYQKRQRQAEDAKDVKFQTTGAGNDGAVSFSTSTGPSSSTRAPHAHGRRFSQEAPLLSRTNSATPPHGLSV